ncbi:MAG: hypothetical protein Kow006_08730 [Gammaproteobacteria bacterium]
MLKKAAIALSVLLVVSLTLVVLLRDQFTEATFFIVSGMLGLFTLTVVPFTIFLVIGINVFSRREGGE